ncbi:MAG: DNA lyase [Spirochaetia bacterium]|nr:DNA lyase [Spirochaetia bacterium]
MDINLEQTLFCGQSFAWTKTGSLYEAVLFGRCIRLDEQNFASVVADDPELAAYFDMDWEYAKAQSYLSSLDPYLASCITRYEGLHLLNQDPWEVLISFLLSQNNNIKRIRSMYQTLCCTYGSEVATQKFAFPSPQQLEMATEAELRALGMGFRAPYLLDAIRYHALLDEIPNLSTEKAATHLMTIKGVGPKVAACILVFAFHRMDAFPLDTWMLKVMKSRYPGKDASFFEPYAALAQQYLFHAERLGGGVV